MKAVAPLFVSLLALTSATVDCSSTPPAATAANEGPVTTTAAVLRPQTSETDVTALRDELRTLLLDRAAWMRLYIIDAAGRLPSIDASAQRLESGDASFGDAIAPFYGPAAGARLAGILDDELKAARATVGATVAKDASAFERSRGQWYESSDRVASFFTHESPYVTQDGLVGLLRTWVNDEIGQAQARVAGDWTTDGSSADESEGQALALADVLTGAIFQQFPHQVKPATLRPPAESLHLVMRDLFYAHATLMHEYVVERVAGMPSAMATMNRLAQVANDTGKPLAHFYGGTFGYRVSTMLGAGLDHARATIDAALANDEANYGAAKRAWYENADLVALLLASKNRDWSEHALSLSLRTGIDDAWDDASARMHADWAADVRAADAMRRQASGTADLISTGIIVQHSL